jgi:hypothetical protein
MLSLVLLGSYFVASASVMKSSSLRMTMSDGKYESSGAIPVRENESMKSSLIKLVKAVPLAAAFSMVPEKASAKAPESPTSLGDDAYTELGNMKMCKILTGMWQVSGAHGYEPKKQSAINEMKHCAGIAQLFLAIPAVTSDALKQTLFRGTETITTPYCSIFQMKGFLPSILLISTVLQKTTWEHLEKAPRAKILRRTVR